MTAQMSDSIRYEGKEHALFACPLHGYRDSLHPLPRFVSPHTANWRGYVAEWEIEGRAFAAKMLPPGQSASGFFYFQTGFMRSSTLQISGLKDARSGEDLFYYEIPLAQALK